MPIPWSSPALTAGRWWSWVGLICGGSVGRPDSVGPHVSPPPSLRTGASSAAETPAPSPETASAPETDSTSANTHPILLILTSREQIISCIYCMNTSASLFSCCSCWNWLCCWAALPMYESSRSWTLTFTPSRMPSSSAALWDWRVARVWCCCTSSLKMIQASLRAVCEFLHFLFACISCVVEWAGNTSVLSADLISFHSSCIILHCSRWAALPHSRGLHYWACADRSDMSRRRPWRNHKC